MANTRLALKAVRSAVKTALDAAYQAGQLNVKGQVYVGWPTSTKLSEIFGQPSPRAMVTLWPLRGKNTRRYAPVSVITLNPNPGTTALINSTGHILTIGGTPTAGDVVHAFFRHPTLDANALVAAGDSPAVVAGKIATSVNAFAAPGVSASATGAAITLTGAIFTRVNVGGAGQLSREIGRIERPVQVSVWANVPTARADIVDTIQTNLGGTDSAWLTAADGTSVYIELIDDNPSDKAESSYSSFRQDIFFKIEYGLTRVIPGTQVGGVELQSQINSNPVVTTYAGGS